MTLRNNAFEIEKDLKRYPGTILKIQKKNDMAVAEGKEETAGP